MSLIKKYIRESENAPQAAAVKASLKEAAGLSRLHNVFQLLQYSGMVATF
jgi:hypothetical protein